ncbi:hypothetical protein H4S06_002459 [Coemansia sp. BCRC 34490]|nr:hypothetical protein H4S06_002459 [Coemansia sp. BCRC 34490]
MSLLVSVPADGDAGIAYSDYYLPAGGDLEAYTPFLQYEPSRSVAFGVGGVFAALVVATAFIATIARARVFLVAATASASLAASMFLRGSLVTMRDGSAAGVRMYQASYLLDSVGAILMVFLTLVLVAVWIARQSDAERRECEYESEGKDACVPLSAVLVAAVAGVITVGSIALECTAIPLVFSHASLQLHRTGHQLHIAAMAVVLAASGGGLLVTLWAAATAAPSVLAMPMTPLELTSLAAPFGMLCVWASYALVQAKLPLESVANTSEVAWYLLNVLPLALVLFLWVVVNAPRFFVLGSSGRQSPRPMGETYRHHAFAGFAGIGGDRKAPRPTSYYAYPYVDEPPSYPMRLPSGHARKAGDMPESSSSNNNSSRIQRAIQRYA